MVLPKTTIEQRLPLYADVESLLSVGFLTHPVEVNGTLFQLRSLNAGDLFLLRSRVSGRKSTDKDWQSWAIATSIWMVNGWVTLGEPHSIPIMYQKVKNLSPIINMTLFNVVMGLHKRQTKAITAAESYCFELTSRYRWKSYLSGAINTFSGIPGADKLGLNYIQQMWTVYNGHEDQRTDEENAWERAKLVASAHAPKGIKQIDEADRNRREAEENRRQQVMDTFYYASQGIALDKLEETLGPKYIRKAKTVEDLEKEMYDWVTGREDWHDKTVREYKERVIAKYEQEKKESEARAVALRELQETSSDQPVPLISYTPEQLAQILADRDQGRGGVKQVFEGPAREAVFQKYLANKPVAGNLKAKDGRLVTEGEA